MEISWFNRRGHLDWYKSFGILLFVSLTSLDSCLHLIDFRRDIRFHWWLEISGCVGPPDHFNYNASWVFLLGNIFACGPSCHVCQQKSWRQLSAYLVPDHHKRGSITTSLFCSPLHFCHPFGGVGLCLCLASCGKLCFIGQWCRRLSTCKVFVVTLYRQPSTLFTL